MTGVYAGHAYGGATDLDVTLSIYAHINLDAMREALDAIEWET